jgi:hypothetical protein
MNHIIVPEEVKEYGRAMSSHIDRKVLESLIEETENMDIVPALGVALVRELSEATENEHYTTLLEGGYYNDGNAHLQGLKSAMAYYVQAKLVKTNDNQITRFGVMQKDSEYGTRPSLAERNDQYNDLCAVADQYLRDTLEYLNIYRSRYPLFECGGRIRNNRTIYRIIGE